MKPRSDFSARRDSNKARTDAFLSAIIQCCNIHFNPVYGDNQLGLILLGTRPEYRQRGAATALIEWGIQKAREERLAITLFSGEQALGLYRKLGFIEIANCHVQLDGEEECMDLPVMVLKPWKDE
jgi:GNAT superfamily N-acetyltransferase